MKEEILDIDVGDLVLVPIHVPVHHLVIVLFQGHLKIGQEPEEEALQCLLNL